MRCPHVGTVMKIFLFTEALLNIAKCEFFTSVAELATLFNTEREIAETLQKYVEVEEKRLHKVKRASKQYADLYRLAKTDAETFLSNPVNAFLLVKRLSADWLALNELVLGIEGQVIFHNISTKGLSFPDKTDLSGAVEALIRLQETYVLNTSTIARGHIAATIPSFQLTASDCFELGRQAYYAKDVNHSLKWMEEALRKIDEDDVKTINKTQILEYMAFAAYDLYDFKRGLAITEEIVKLDPKYPRTYENIIYYQVKFSEHQAMLAKQKSGKETTENPIRAINVTGEIWKEKDIHEAFRKLCRGEHLRSLEEESKLSCYYTTNDNSYLLLQPAKVEVLNLNPRIVLFHGVISDKEIHTLKELATPRLQRAVVQDTITGKIEPSTDRISKSTSLPYESHEIMTRLNKRIEDISGLTTFTSEQIHVINYGIGGHYEPHFDFAQAAEKIAMFRQLGNRIATWIFYMSDVPAGGATVFPIIGVDIKPVKGAAGFWYNLFKNGEGDKRTLHAACPVLAGSKWVGNLWLHERGQEFRRFCSLNPNE